MKETLLYPTACKRILIAFILLCFILAYPLVLLGAMPSLTTPLFINIVDDVADINKKPTDIKLTPSDIPENQPAGTVVGILSTDDPDAGDTHTYSLDLPWWISWRYPDNSSFSIQDDRLLSREIFDYEAKASYTILVRSTDNAGQYLDKEFTINIININEPPVVTNVFISRSNNRIGTTHTGNFTYTDPETGTLSQGKHVFKWYRLSGDDDTILINNAADITYIPVLADGGKSICFEVTPRDNMGLLGLPVKSKFVYINAAPVAGNVHIYAPDLDIRDNIYGRFIYSDIEGNAAGKHTYRWYRSSTPSGSGSLIYTATDTVYRITRTDNDMYIRFEIVPVAVAGSTPGAIVTSDWIGPVGIPSPTATISGIDTVCPGDIATLYLAFEGTAPFTVTYLRNGADAKTISGIEQLNYDLEVTGDGIYTLSSMSDANRKGKVSGTGTVVHYAAPTATISGSPSICEYTNANLTISLTGTPPWNFAYHRNSEEPVSVTNIFTSPRFISVTNAGTYTMVNVSDKYCSGTVSGSANVTVIPAPDVSITGLDPAYSIKIFQMIPVFGHPENGSFTPSLMVVNDTNYFLPYAVGIGIHNIVYSYRDGVTGCYGYDTAVVAVLDANAEITFPENDTKKTFCYNDPPFTILGYNTVNAIGTFSISGGGHGLVDNHDNTATIYPSQLNNGTFEVTYTYFDKTYLEVSESFEVESVSNIWFIGFDKSSYCDNDDPVKLNGNVEGGVFSGKAVTGSMSAGFYYEPQRSDPGIDTVFYTYTTAWGCSRQIYKDLVVRDAADVNFTVKDICISPDEPDSTEFINLTTTTDPVISWKWNFGGADSSTLKNPKHLYTKGGFKAITLMATTGYCQSENQIWFEFGIKPKADFRLAIECFNAGRPVKFINQSVDSSDIDDYKWKFYVGNKTDSVMTKNTEYLYNNEGHYEVQLFVRSHLGCTDTLEKTIQIRPTYELQAGSSYLEGFESEITGWTSASENTVNSWTLGEPLFGFDSDDLGENAWYTDINTDPVGRAFIEQSSVISPCFSFQGIQKPMVRFFLYSAFNTNWNDGAVLQYKADSSIVWNNIGDLNDGINWYKDHNISGKPGGDRTIGWSTSSRGYGWVSARHSLDELKGKKDIQFRIAYGSDGTAIGTNGLAFDNFQIGERSKIVMIEHFTNAGDSASMVADSELDGLANSNPLDIVDIQYHTSFPGADPFNEQNKVDPGTRVLYYQLSSVPVSILNGGIIHDFIFDHVDNQLDPLLIKNQALLDPTFSIDLETSMVNNTLSVKAELRPLKILLNRQVTLHIAIVERKITGVTGANGDTLFESVLKTILSSTSYTNDWDPAVDIKNVEKTWNLKNTYSSDEIRVVAFVQDEASKEIYQAMIDKFDVPDALIDKNITYRSKNSAGFIVYPNPLRDEACLRFNEEILKKIRVELFDINGKLFMTKELFPGAKEYSITMEDFPEGLYFMKISSDNEFFGLQKLIIEK